MRCLETDTNTDHIVQSCSLAPSVACDDSKPRSQPRRAILLIFAFALYLLPYPRSYNVPAPSSVTPSQDSSPDETIPEPRLSIQVHDFPHEPASEPAYKALQEPVEEGDGLESLFLKPAHDLSWDRMDFAPSPKIAKVSILYGKNAKREHVRALKSHWLHNERFNYAMYALRVDVLGEFRNKRTYLLSLIVQG